MANYWNFRNKDEDGKPEIVLSAGATDDRILLFNILSGRYGIPRIAEGKSKDGTTGELVIDFLGDGPAQPQAFTIPDYDPEQTYTAGALVSAEIDGVRGIFRSDVDENTLAPWETLGWTFKAAFALVSIHNYSAGDYFPAQAIVRVPLSVIGIELPGHFYIKIPAPLDGGGYGGLTLTEGIMDEIKNLYLSGFNTDTPEVAFPFNDLSVDLWGTGVGVWVQDDHHLIMTCEYVEGENYPQRLVEEFYGSLEFPLSPEEVNDVNEAMNYVFVDAFSSFYAQSPVVSPDGYLVNETIPGGPGSATWTLLAGGGVASKDPGPILPGGPIILK